MGLGTIPVGVEALRFAEHVHQRHGLLIVATPSASDQFYTRCFDRNMAWADLERSLPVLPLEWWHDLAENRPVADALRWATAKGFVELGPVSEGRLLIRTEDGFPLRFRSEGSPSYYRNIETHIEYLRQRHA